MTRIRVLVVAAVAVVALVVIALVSSASPRLRQAGGSVGVTAPVARPSRGFTGLVAEPRVPGCKKPTPSYRVIASSQRAIVYRRGMFNFKGCMRGTHRLYDLEIPRSPSLVRTRGRWVAFPISGIYNEGSGPGYYDLYEIDLRNGRFRQMNLLSGHRLTESRLVRDFALDGHGVVLYVQGFGQRDRLILRGQTKRRRLGSGPPSTFHDLRLRHGRASWTENGKPRSARFGVIDRRLPYEARSRAN